MGVRTVWGNWDASPGKDHVVTRSLVCAAMDVHTARRCGCLGERPLRSATLAVVNLDNLWLLNVRQGDLCWSVLGGGGGGWLGLVGSVSVPCTGNCKPKCSAVEVILLPGGMRG